MRKGEPIAGLGGLALLVSLFAPWYDDRSGWASLAVLDVLLALFAVLAIAVPLATLATRGPAKSIGTAVLASALGWLAIVLVAVRVVSADGDRGAGLWVALAGAVVAWIGAWLAMRDESTPGAAPPDVPRRPTPAA
jgi:hypothetical protein